MPRKTTPKKPRVATEKQRAFAELVATGECKTLTAAYDQVYGGNISSSARRVEASRLWNNPVVQDVARDIKARVGAQRSIRLAGDADAIRRALSREAEQADRAADRIAALKLLGQQRAVSLFAERLEVSEPDAVSDAEVLAEIEQIVRAAEEMPDDNEPIH